MPLLLALLACAPPSGDALNPWPAPDAWRRDDYVPPGSRAAASPALFEACTYLLGGPEDVEHHNMGLVVDGLLVLPWAPEDGGGGLSLFDMADPCAPVRVADAYHPHMRESHTLGLSLRDDGRYVAVSPMHEVVRRLALQGREGVLQRAAGLAQVGGVHRREVARELEHLRVGGVEVAGAHLALHHARAEEVSGKHRDRACGRSGAPPRCRG
jgi:hypothetical protein